MVESLDDFLSYSNRGEKTSYLSKWKEDGSIIVWLSKRIAPKRLWRHRLKRIVELKDQQTQRVEHKIWSDNYVCLESEDILKDQNLLNKLTGQRKRPPHTCPECLFLEYVRGLITTKKIDWLTPVMRYSTDEEEVIVHAQGLVGYPKGDKMNDEQKRQLKDAGIFMRDSWQEDARAKMNWIFVCAEHAHPEKGLQVAIEPALLGDKVRSVINKAIEAAELVKPGNGAAGNPLQNPYPIKFSYNDAEGIAFGEKYDATGIQGVSPNAEILALIDGEPPTEAVEGLRRPPNLAQLRQNLEEHCLLKDVPWDALFKPAYDLYKDNGWDTGSAPETTPAKDTVKEAVSAALKDVTVTSSVPKEDVYSCDDCGGDMLASETKCKKCGRDYAPPPPPPPAPKRSRSAVSGVSNQVSTQQVTVEIDDSFPKPKGEEDDGIPF